MVPKFRGDSEDWLDEERKQGAAPRGKPAKTDRAATPLDPGQANATVACVYPKLCRARLDEDGAELLCSYRRASIFRAVDGAEDRERAPVAVGDRILVERSSPQDGIVTGLCQRRNHLSRPAPGRDKMQQVIAANVDLLVIVASAAEPAFSPGMIDRYLVAAAHAGISAILCLNKIDLLGGVPLRPADPYRALGYDVFDVSSKRGLGLESLRQRLLDRTVVFSGQSGVGKTSLLGTLLGEDAGRVGDVSKATGKGQHTTTGAVLLRGPGESRWIDTPGVREFGLAELEPARLRECFPELRDQKCPQADCFHYKEADCRAQSLPRIASYRRILESLLAGEG